MPIVYSDDLRRKLLEARQRGEGSLTSLAARFSVSAGRAKKVSRAWLHTGQMERPAGAKRGPASKLTVEVRARLRAWIAAQADLTLEELRSRLRQELELSVSVGRVAGTGFAGEKASLHAAEQDTCHPTQPASTPSKSAGRKSSKRCAPPKRAPSKPWPPSPRRTPPIASATAATTRHCQPRFRMRPADYRATIETASDMRGEDARKRQPRT